MNIDAPQGDGPQAVRADRYADISTLEFEFESVSEIYMNAVFEHFQRHEALRILRKFYSWLKAGGKVTIVVPDFWGTVRKLKKSKSLEEKAFWYRHLFGPQDHPQYGNHLDGFDPERLKRIFEIVGFGSVKVTAFGDMPFLRVEAVKVKPYSSTEEFKQAATKYLLYHEYRADGGECFEAWLKALDIDVKATKTKSPVIPLPTHGDSLGIRLKMYTRRVLGVRRYESIKKILGKKRG